MNLTAVSPVLIDVIVKRSETTTLHNVGLALLGSLFIALTAQVAIPLPFSPVPITGQTLGVLVTGTILGANRGALAVLFYLMEGAVGLPVFAGLKGGLPYLIGPTGGYLFGFIAAAYIAGYLAQRGWDRDIFKSLLSMTIANLSIYVVGLPVLALYTGTEKAPLLGLYPFIFGDILKIMFAAIMLPLVWKGFCIKARPKA